LNVLLGVTGSIAAYKAAPLVRLLRGRGHDVHCALSRAATSFVTPLTLEILSGRTVYQEEYLSPGGEGQEAHIAAARWADVLLVAPATAHLLSRLALGLADDFLSTTALAFRGPLIVAPAMHAEMWVQPVVQEHVETLKSRGVTVVGPLEGALASGEVGLGRMVEPEDLVAAVEGALHRPLQGRSVVVTAGPTREHLDPVRFLTNRSSGRMGFALAAEAARRGAEVLLVAGPVELPTPPGVERIAVTTARDMKEAVARRAAQADLIIMAAAVCDFRPTVEAAQKLKKAEGVPAVKLEVTEDILTALAEIAPQAIRVGFAAETDDLESHARGKLNTKGAHFVVANDVSRTDIGFESEDNEVTVFRREGPPVFLSRRPKAELAAQVLDLLTAALEKRDSQPVAPSG
jgi:phosphopantothenoylcysteine decarboxylase/phosphopantothenate--cysteine ligase